MTIYKSLRPKIYLPVIVQIFPVIVQIFPVIVQMFSVIVQMFPVLVQIKVGLMFLFIFRNFTYHLNTASIPAIQYVRMYQHFIFFV